MQLEHLFSSSVIFCGAKIALLHGERVLVYERDDYAHIQYPGFIDLPGGGREGDETPYDCVTREVMEEFGIKIAQNNILWGSQYPNLLNNGKPVVFFVGNISPEQIAKIEFGDEGHSWRMMGLDEFFSNPNVIPAFVQRLNDYFKHESNTSLGG